MGSNKISMGFSLIELMVVLTVIGLLVVTVAYPSYQSQIQRAHTELAKAYLLDVSQKQNHFFLRNNRYASHLDSLGTAPSNRLSALYNIQIVGASENEGGMEYTIRATPKYSLSDDTLGTLELNHIGTKSGNWNE